MSLFERVYKEYKNAKTEYIAVRKNGLAECFLSRKSEVFFERVRLGLK